MSRAHRMESNNLVTEGIACKISVFGDSGVGKTALLNRLVFNTFRQSSHPTVMCHQTKDLMMPGGVRASLSIWDCGGQNDSVLASRPSVVNESDTILLCFSMSDLSSLHSAMNTWLPAIQQCLSAGDKTANLVTAAANMRPHQLGSRGQTMLSASKAGVNSVDGSGHERMAAVIRRRHSPAFLLVGCKSDQRQGGVQREEIAAALNQLPPGSEFAETSSKLSDRSVKLAFQSAFLVSAMGRRETGGSKSGQSSKMATTSSASSFRPVASIRFKNGRSQSVGSSGMIKNATRIHPTESMVKAVAPPQLPSSTLGKERGRNKYRNCSGGKASSGSNNNSGCSSASSSSSSLAASVSKPSESGQSEDGPSESRIPAVNEAASSSPGSTLSGRMSASTSTMSIRSKSSTLSSTNSDTSMISISTSGGGRAASSSSSKGSTTAANSLLSSSCFMRTPGLSRRLGGSSSMDRSASSMRERKRHESAGEKLVTIRCQRLNADLGEFEEVDIEIPEAVYHNMQLQQQQSIAGCSSDLISRNSSQRKSLANRLKSIFI